MHKRMQNANNLVFEFDSSISRQKVYINVMKSLNLEIRSIAYQKKARKQIIVLERHAKMSSD